MEVLKVKKFNKDAVSPNKSRNGDAGWDLSSNEDMIIPPNSWKLVSTGIGFTVPMGTYGRIAPRSGVSTKGILVGAGVIDKSFCGEVKVLMFNFSHKDSFQVNKNDRIAQLLLEKIVENACVIEVENLEETVRGESGFGSSGQ